MNNLMDTCNICKEIYRYMIMIRDVTDMNDDGLGMK
jgi:hypothetical protein